MRSGGLIADVKNDFIATVFLDLDEGAMPAVRSGYAALAAEAVRWLCEEQGYRGDRRLVYSADMRYRGQSYEIETELDPDHVAQGDVAGIAEAFHRRHEQVYEHADREAAVQMINLRMVIAGVESEAPFSGIPGAWTRCRSRRSSSGCSWTGRRATCRCTCAPISSPATVSPAPR